MNKLRRLFPSKILITITTIFALSANAVVVDIFHDDHCNEPAGQCNVWDSTCAPTGSFSSMRIVTAGGSGQSFEPTARITAHPNLAINASARTLSQELASP
ncbi:hypothetical protein QBC47DRAFT_438241 [Echria macrotheca]|uniref:Uncharacterized protein n=1 Tax=Echria macrotheca TaxID=438768 RepID=A0AAJ0BKH7_9PEZI|nr:hypothetical protein QBC47DRAFT_438241 [Echria macrotheca]